MGKRFLEMLREDRLTLIMSLPKNDPELAACAWENGADVVKVHINVEHRASKTHFKSLREEYENLNSIIAKAKGPVGIVLGGDIKGPEEDFEAAACMGFEFISLYMHHAPVKVLSSNCVIKMLAADYSYTINEIEEFKGLAQVLEASIIRPEEYGTLLNARDILHYRQLVNKSGLPVVVPTQKKISIDDLTLLKETGINGIMIGAVVTGMEKDTISRTVASFKEHILKL